ncbi:hypothetical protein J5I09_22250, partial [Escherichia coli]|uniref:hypothetical protein n=1 Tax=Escherichia coli TaxID=562 RepID=UPI0022517368
LVVWRFRGPVHLHRYVNYCFLLNSLKINVTDYHLSQLYRSGSVFNIKTNIKTRKSYVFLSIATLKKSTIGNEKHDVHFNIV